MIALKTTDIRNNFKKISNLVCTGERVLISRPSNKNIVILSESEYNKLEKAEKNNEYLAKIDASIKQIEEGKIVVKTIDELEDMAERK